MIAMSNTVYTIHGAEKIVTPNTEVAESKAREGIRVTAITGGSE